MKNVRIVLPLAAIIAALAVQTTYAHGFGDRYDLPLPLGFFVVGGATAVIFSFVIIGLLVKGEFRDLNTYPRLNLLGHTPLRIILSGPVLWPIKLGSVFLFILVLATGLFGTTRPISNLAPTFVWVIWWIGTAFFVAVFGNIWALVNPWKIIYGWGAALYDIIWPDQQFTLGLQIPENWGVWPAVVLFFAFSWLENAASESSIPSTLAWFVIVYSIVTLGGMFIYGKHQWLRQGEVFSVVFGIITRFSITEVRTTNPNSCHECSTDCRGENGSCVDCYECFEYSDAAHRVFNLRPPAVGLDQVEATPLSVVAMVMFLLATVTFDGFSATPEWIRVQSLFITTFGGLNSPFLNGIVIANTLGLLAFPLGFAALFWSFSRMMYWAVGNYPPAVPTLIGAFVFSLIPIALAYNYAHFLSLLLIQGQQIIALASDPFGAGWDLFGTAEYLINIRVTNARFIWIFSVTVIVVGHIVAVYLAHIQAIRLYPSQKLVLRSQLPMLVLMVVYTVVSLWIVSRPITE